MVGRDSSPIAVQATPTTVADREDTSLSTRENRVPMMPGMNLPER